jgi:indole-3-glycerol phosphate synthase
MILDEIAQKTFERVRQSKQSVSEDILKEQAYAMPKGNKKFQTALKSQNLSFICEIKKASPAKGLIAESFDPVQIAKEYEIAGADAISVLTEPFYFQGSNDYLKDVKENVTLPVLRKDFVVDAYQIYEAKTIGADAVLLICALLETKNPVPLSDNLHGTRFVRTGGSSHQRRNSIRIVRVHLLLA